jgi:hypothetical protein
VIRGQERISRTNRPRELRVGSIKVASQGHPGTEMETSALEIIRVRLKVKDDLTGPGIKPGERNNLEKTSSVRRSTTS